MQRPLRSQSPKRVGSGPEGPPISRSAGLTSPVAAGTAQGGGSDGTEAGVEEFFSGLVCISPQVCQNSALPATKPGGLPRHTGFMNRR